MKPNGVHLTAWMFGILATLAGALGGAAFNHFFGRQAAIEAEQRRDARKAADDYFSKGIIDKKVKAGARIRFAFYEDSDVLHKFAEANRRIAEDDVSPSQRGEMCKAQTPDGERVVEAVMEFIAAVREQRLPGDPLEIRDLAAVICPFVDLDCYGEKYVSHLIDCGDASIK